MFKTFMVVVGKLESIVNKQLAVFHGCELFSHHVHDTVGMGVGRDTSLTDWSPGVPSMFTSP